MYVLRIIAGEKFWNKNTNDPRYSNVLRPCGGAKPQP